MILIQYTPNLHNRKEGDFSSPYYYRVERKEFVLFHQIKVKKIW
jgi:hypothetical protein